jgi:hypothetical protein
MSNRKQRTGEGYDRPAHRNGTRKSEPRLKLLLLASRSEMQPHARRAQRSERSSEAGSAMIPVYERGICLGFVCRRPAGIEAFDADNLSLGTFQDEREAVTVIWRHRRRQHREF